MPQAIESDHCLALVSKANPPEADKDEFDQYDSPNPDIWTGGHDLDDIYDEGDDDEVEEAEAQPG